MKSDGSGEEKDTAVIAAAPLDTAKLRARIHHHLRTCSATVKRARVFEVQKTIKKLKTANKEERENLEGLLQALKASQHGQIAAVAIKNKLLKARLLPRTRSDDQGNIEERFPLVSHVQELDAELEGYINDSDQVGGEEERARSKLLSNKHVSEEVSDVVRAISSLLRGGGEEARDQTKVDDRYENSKVNKVEARRSRVELKSAAKMNPESTRVDESKEKLSISQENSSEDGKTRAAKRNDTLKATKQTEPAQSSRRHEENDVKQVVKRKRLDTPESAIEEESDDDGYDATDLRLPMLSTGFVGGKGFNLGRGSEDEWSDGEDEMESIDEDADGTRTRKEAKKNRMGQRERRAIWEKRFGKGANHLKLLEKETRQRVPLRQPRGYHDRDAGWSGPLGKEPAASTTTADKSASAVKTSHTTKSEGEMHPSWIAKQKQKERAEAAARSRGSATKIVFD